MGIQKPLAIAYRQTEPSPLPPGLMPVPACMGFLPNIAKNLNAIEAINFTEVCFRAAPLRGDPRSVLANAETSKAPQNEAKEVHQ